MFYTCILILIYLFQTDETIISNTTISSYPIEVTDNENVLNASRIINHSESIACEENIERTLSDKFLQVASSAFLEANRSQSNVTDTSICKYYVFTLLYVLNTSE